MGITEPRTGEDFDQYFDLRWRILRKPWGQPKGSEKDELEDKSVHIMVTDNSNIMGVGRGHLNSKDEAQIRYMAIEDNNQGKGIGKIILNELEERLKDKGAKYIVLNARKSVSNFYKKHGYEIVGKGPLLFVTITDPFSDTALSIDSVANISSKICTLELYFLRPLTKLRIPL